MRLNTRCLIAKLKLLSSGKGVKKESGTTEMGTVIGGSEIVGFAEGALTVHQVHKNEQTSNIIIKQ